jgi:hypothetical protein
MPLLRALYHDYGADHLGGRGYVEVQRLAVLRRRKVRSVGEGRLQLVKRLLGLDAPGEPLVFLKEPVEGQAFLTELRNETAQGGKAPQHLLDPLEVSNRTHSFETATFSGLASMPRCETMYPNSMPRGTPKTHFSGFNFTPLARRQLNVMRRSLTRSSAYLVFTTISSTYASRVRPM